MENEASGSADRLWPGEIQVFSETACFLCGVTLTEETSTDEDVFPKWLLREFGLQNARIDLLNRTPIRYPQLKIPCCSSCNNVFLSRIEKKVRTAYFEGTKAFVELDRKVLFLWLCKIAYGLLVREMYLPVDRSDRSAGPIVPAEFLAQFRMHHYLLQAAIGRVEWEGSPASILIYRTQVGPSPADNFDYCDGPSGPFLAMRLGSIGIISVLQDWGALENHAWAQLDIAKEIELAPIQFRELMAVGRYWAYKFNRVPKYLVGQRDGRGHVMCMPLMGLSAKPLWDEFDVEEYAHALAGTLGVQVNQVLVGDQVMTWLKDEEGNPRRLPFEVL